jgi:hypothetical protein
VNENHELGFFVHKKITSAVKRVEFLSDWMPYIIPRGRWCDIILNVHAPIENKIDMKGSFYKKLKHVFNKFPIYHMKIFLGDFNAKICSSQQNWEFT